MLETRGFARKYSLLLGTALVSSAIVVGAGFYHTSAEADTPPAAAEAPQTPTVPVQTVVEQDVRVWSQYPGRLQAVDSAEIRPEVGGKIVEIKFKDGQTVAAGDVLFVIDPTLYEAAVEKAEANLSAAYANAKYAKSELDRANNLIQTQAIAQSMLDERTNSNRIAQANIKAAEASLKQAKLDLDHAFVKAPISGRISRAEITVGNLVQTSPNAPLLTTIVSNDGIYADFEVDEQTYVKHIRSSASTSDQEQQIPVELSFPNDESKSYKGTIFSFDNRINTTTGTIRARAKFPNEDGTLMPGMFVNVNLANGLDSTALLVPEHAIGNDQNKKFVFIVDKDNKIAYREITPGQKVSENRIVLKGIQSGDRVVVEGIQQLRPDMKVQVKEITG